MGVSWRRWIILQDELCALRFFETGGILCMEFEASYLGLFVVLVLLVDITIHSSRSYLLTNSVFRLIAWVTLVEITIGVLLDLLATGVVFISQPITLWTKTILNMLYLIFFPVSTMQWLYYVVSVSRNDPPRNKRFMLPFLIEVCLFGALMLTSPFNGLVFSIDSSGLFIKGSLYWLLEASSNICTIGMLVILIKQDRYLDTYKRTVLWTVPIFCFLALVLQSWMPPGPDMANSTGTNSMVCLLLIVYLNIQNRRITYDMNVGVPNRQSFDNKVKKEYERANTGTVCIVTFSNINTLSRRFGDDAALMLRQSISSLIVENTRTHNTYLYGPDEYAIFFEGENTSPMTSLFIERMKQRFEQPWEIPISPGTRGKREIFPLRVDATYGLLEYPKQAPTSKLMYEALDFMIGTQLKSTQNGGLHKFDPILLMRRKRLQDVINAVNNAIIRKTIHLQYQPIINIATGKIEYAECIIRVQDPLLGWISIKELNPAIKESGMENEVGTIILQALNALQQQLGDHRGHLQRISLNTSSVMFEKDWFGKRFEQAVQKLNFPSHFIALDIQEDKEIDQFSMVKANMQHLQKLGVSLVLDNFGSGYSSLLSLLGLPFNAVKFDPMVFGDSKHRDTVLKEAVSVIHKVGLPVFAQDIMDEQQYELCKEMGIDFAQGSFFSHALSESEFIDLIHEDTGDEYTFVPSFMRS